MHQPFQLQIAEPCHENWDKMTAQQQGRFCGSCQKIVVDFTRMTDDQLVAYFKNYDGNTCGRFNSWQLDRTIQATVITEKPWWHQWAFAAAFTSLLLVNKANAQGSVQLKGKVACENDAKPLVNLVKNAATQADRKLLRQLVMSIQPVKKIPVSGWVKDENNEPIAYASVLVKGQAIGTMTDSAGHFSFLGVTITDSTELQISSVGYESKNIPINNSSGEELEIVLNDNAAKLGEVVVTGYTVGYRRTLMGGLSVVRSYTIFDDVKHENTDKPQVLVYPNPARKGDRVTLKPEKKGHYAVQLIGAAGALKLQTNIRIELNGGTASLQLPGLLSNGQYFIKTIDQKTKQQSSTALLVID